MQDHTAPPNKATRKRTKESTISPERKTRCKASDDVLADLQCLVREIPHEILMTGKNIDLLNQEVAELRRGYYDPEGIAMMFEASAYRLRRYLQLLRKLPTVVGEPVIDEEVLPKGLGRSLKVVNINVARQGNLGRKIR